MKKDDISMMKAAVIKLPPDDRKTVEALADTIRKAVKIHGDNGLMALALVAIEEEVALE